MSLPSCAVSDVNRSPVSCMPSPESPSNRMTTRSRYRTDFDRRAAGMPSAAGLAGLVSAAVIAVAARSGRTMTHRRSR